MQILDYIRQQTEEGGWLINATSLLGTIVSIVGLILTAKTFLRVRNIEKSYTRQALLPKWISKLRGNTSNITAFLNQKEEAKTATEFAKCSANLNSLSEHMPEKHKKEIHKLKTEIDNINPSKPGMTGIMRTCEQNLYKVIQIAQNEYESLKWRATRDDE